MTQGGAMFHSVNDVTASLLKQEYLPSNEISTVVYLAERMGKPVLAEGPAGVGKTELAKVWARASGRELIRLQCYEGLDESKALYEWEYAKQMLYTQLLRDKLSEVMAGAATLAEAADRIAAEESVFFSRRFLLPRPLLRALLSEKPALLLIDEIDRADAEFEAFLLEVLSDFQVSVPELGTLRARHQPMVVLTSNNTRELSEALKRRALYLYVDYPSLDSEIKIVRMRAPDLSADIARQIVEVVQRLRELELKKSPSVAETVDWAKALIAINARHLDEKTLNDTLSVVLKHEADLQRARRALQGPRREATR
ncbi:MAG: MoxR family ATPase [Thermoflexales bacterium]|nr:MoxR family ATPase [Thermoflexales bacterium]